MERVKSLDPLERIGVFSYAIASQFPPKFRIPLFANRHFFALTWDISKGKAASQSPRELRYKLFPNYETSVTGLENIPNNGTFIIASNHCSEDPLRGSWQTTVIADIILDKTRDINNRRVRFIVDSQKDSTGIFGEKLKDEFRKRQSHTLNNIAAALDHIPLNKIKEAVELLHLGQKGQDILGVFPTGKAEFAFKTPVSKEVAGLFEIAGKHGIPVLHIGAWHDNQKKTFIINIGEAAIYKNNPKDPNSKQLTAQKVMYSIASLLPSQMRGIYAS